MKEIVILGAGYAGLSALKKLQKKGEGIHITLVDRNDYHYEATELHEIAAGTQPAEKICYYITDVVQPEMTSFIQDAVTKIDPDEKKVTLAGGKTLGYDYLIVSLGFESETFGIPGADEYALPMVNVEMAVKIHEHLLDMMKKYRETQVKEYLKIIICGAGFTGIELLGELEEGRKALAEVAGVEEKEIEISCVNSGKRLLPMFSEKLADAGLDHLKERGIHLLTGYAIKEVKKDTVVCEEKSEEPEETELTAKTIIWTTGVKGSHVIGDSGFAEKRGRVMVTENLTDPICGNVYLIGDVSAVMDKSCNRPFPTTAQISMKMGEYTAKHILAVLKGEKIEPFSFKPLGTVASLGNTYAFGQVGKAEIKGYPASVVKKGIADKSLLGTGGVKELLSKGRFDFYH